MSIRHPIAELRLFQNLTLKFKGQGHGWGHSSKSQCGSNTLSTHVPFVPCQLPQPPPPPTPPPPPPPIPEIQHFQNLTLKIKGQGHGWRNNSKSQCRSNILSTHIPFVPCQSALPFLSYDFFQNLTLKFKGLGYGWGHSSKSQCSV